MAQAPRDIPGFYYDHEKGKYFRIQPNHRAPTKESKYTSQAVEIERQHDQEARKKQRVEDKKIVQNVKRSKWLSHPIHGLDLSVRLGTPSRTGGSLGDGIRRQYAHFLRPSTVFAYGNPAPIFAVERYGKTLFTTAAVDGRWDSGREMCVTPLSDAGRSNEGESSSAKSMNDDCDGEVRYIYDQKDTIPILNAASATAILPISSSIVLWANHHHDDTRGDGSSLNFSKQYASDSVPWQNWRDEFGAWGTSVTQLHTVVWDMAAPQTGGDVVSNPEHIVLAAGNGLKLWSGGRGDLSDISDRAEAGYSSVRFKDNNVFMAATRAGVVEFADLRVKERVARLSHQSRVTGIRSMRNDNLVLVNGLGGCSVYDLRYASASPKKGTDHFAMRYLDLEVPNMMTQKRPTMGFDYDEELNIMASAGTDFGSGNKVGLWDCGTGKMIEEGPLTKRKFKEPVTCLQMVDLRGYGPSSKSILTISGGIIEEWHV